MTLPKEFLGKWIEAASKHSTALVENWEKLGTYTSIILNNDDCILTEVANSMSLRSYPRNYYSVDGILYTDHDLVPKRKENEYWFRSISVAFEHEHNFNHNLYQEIAHLLILRSELSVIVTYPEGDESPLMTYFHDIIKNCSHSKELSEK